MNSLDELDGESEGTLWRDIFLTLLIAFIAVAIVLLTQMNKLAAQNTEQTPRDPFLERVIVEIRWPDNWDTDVDLWVKAPGDVPVGYSNQGGVYTNLLRDDLGTRNDVTGYNHEVAVVRGVIPGEYTVNVHLFRNTQDTYPVPVQTIVSVKKRGSVISQILVGNVKLLHKKEERTVFRFVLTDEGKLLPNSVNNLFRPLRNATPSSAK